MECSDAANLWMAHNHFLAGTRFIPAQQDSLRRLPSPWRRAQPLEAAPEGSLGAHDPGRPREISQRHALRTPPLRLTCGASDMNEFDTIPITTGETARSASRADSSPSMRRQPSAINDNSRLAELEIENSRLHRLVAPLLIKNQQLRKQG